MRIILYTGKGGVGKTSISAATAIKCAQLGHQTLVLSTDSAHSLGDSLEMEIGNGVAKVADNLYAEEINVNYELKVNWGKIQSFITEFLHRRGFDDFIAEEFAIFPGMEELFSILKLKEYEEQGRFDVAIIDCAPTGSTARMLSFPDIIEWYMERFFHLQRKIVKAIRPIAERIAKVPLPSDEVYFSLEELYQKIDGMKEILTNPEYSSVRIVFNPEKMVIKESQRILTYLNLFNFPVDAAIANRLIPDAVDNSFFSQWKDIETQYMSLAEESFNPLPIFKVHLFHREMVGREMLKQMADEIFEDKDPSTIFFKKRPMTVQKVNNDYLLTIPLPHSDKRDLDLWVRGDELIITMKNYRRNLLLPRTISALPLKEARFEGDELKITFGGDEHGKSSS